MSTLDTMLIVVGGAVGAGIYVGLVMLATWRLYHWVRGHWG